MAKEIKMPLPSAADLFSTQEERDNASRESVRNIPIEEISDFPDHPFKVKMDESICVQGEVTVWEAILYMAMVFQHIKNGHKRQRIIPLFALLPYIFHKLFLP